jgi:hypothetical protein
MSVLRFLVATMAITAGLATASAAYALNPQPEPPNHNMPKIAVSLPPSPVLGR